MRKRLLEYDDVMNAQRKAIYKKRHNALFGDRLDLDTDNMFYDISESIVLQHGGGSNFDEFEMDLLRVLNVQSPVTEEEYKTIDKTKLAEKVYNEVCAHYERKNEKIASRVYPQVKHVYENMPGQFKTIVFPLSDGKREVRMELDLEEAYKSEGKKIAKEYEKNITLGMIDNEWKEHLREMDDLRSAVNNAQYEQKDPLLVYKLESFDLFKNMLNRLNTETTEFLLKVDIPVEEEIESSKKEVSHQDHYQKAQIAQQSGNTSSTRPPQFQGSQGYDQAIQNSEQVREKQQPVTAEPKINRNELCPCGSGKKYKQCHGLQ